MTDAPDRGHAATLAEEMREALSQFASPGNRMLVKDWTARVQALEREVARADEMIGALLQDIINAHHETMLDLGIVYYSESDGVTPGWRNERAEAAEREVARLKGIAP